MVCVLILFHTYIFFFKDSLDPKLPSVLFGVVALAAGYFSVQMGHVSPLFLLFSIRFNSYLVPWVCDSA